MYKSKNMVIILDNGHGIDTPGKRSPIWKTGQQLIEWKFNREIVDGIYFRMEKMGTPIIKLVPEEIDVSLENRVKRANNIHKYDNSAFLISVHANAGGGTGWEIFTSKGKTKSDELATCIFVEAHKVLPEIRMRIDENDGDPDKEADFYLLKNTKCPAVLTENLFMDTWEDCKILLSKEGKDRIIDLHVKGILEYIRLNKLV